jgi:hypothetical protein
MPLVAPVMKAVVTWVFPVVLNPTCGSCGRREIKNNVKTEG